MPTGRSSRFPPFISFSSPGRSPASPRQGAGRGDLEGEQVVGEHARPTAPTVPTCAAGILGIENRRASTADSRMRTPARARPARASSSPAPRGAVFRHVDQHETKTNSTTTAPVDDHLDRREEVGLAEHEQRRHANR